MSEVEPSQVKSCRFFPLLNIFKSKRNIIMKFWHPLNIMKIKYFNWSFLFKKDQVNVP